MNRRRLSAAAGATEPCAWGGRRTFQTAFRDEEEVRSVWKTTKRLMVLKEGASWHFVFLSAFFVFISR